MEKQLRVSLSILVAIWFLWSVPSVAAEQYRVAVYYFPGWKDGVTGFFVDKPWDLIKPYPERKPLLGWYPEGAPDVMDQHLRWMSQYGITHVVFDWYWTDSGKPFLDHALNTYLQLPDNHGVGFAVHWANHRRAPVSLEQWRQIVHRWVTAYFTHPQYMREDNRPVVFIFSPDGLERSAKSFGLTTEDLLAEAQTIARANNLPGLLFVANSAAAFGSGGPAARGYGALTGYVYQRGFSGVVEQYPRTYSEMADQYQRTWDWMLSHINLPYLVPVVLGWDKRPWFPVQRNEKHDACCAGNPAVFEELLRAARRRLDQQPKKTLRTVVICCWNEFGEGNYLEPTEDLGFGYLDRVRRVFPVK